MKKCIYLLAVLLTLFYGNIYACNIWLTDGSGEDMGRTIVKYPNYAQGIYITGCTFTSPFSYATLYIVANDGGVDEVSYNGTTLFDNSGSPNTLASFISCGYVQDELIASTLNLGYGEYDIIIDMNNNGKFDTGIDCFMNPGPDFTFIIVPSPSDPIIIGGIGVGTLNPNLDWLVSTNDNVFRIKLEADEQAAKLQEIHDRYTTMNYALFAAEFGLGLGVNFFYSAAKLNRGGLLLGKFAAADANTTGAPFGYFASQAADVALNNAKARYKAIAADPPRFDYNTIAVLDSVGLDFSKVFNDTVSVFISSLQNLVHIEERALAAELLTLERLQGAVIDSNINFGYLQSFNLLQLNRLKRKVVEARILQWQKLRVFMANNGLTGSVPTDSLLAIKNQIINSGFAQGHRDYFEAMSFTPAEVDAVREGVLANNLAKFQGKTYLNLIDEVLLSEAANRDSLSYSIDSIQVMVAKYENSVSVNPVLSDFSFQGSVVTTAGTAPNTSYTLLGGTANAVSAYQIEYYKADVSLNTSVANTAVSNPGIELLSLHVITNNGLRAYAYHITDVVPAVSSPKILSVQPDSFFIKHTVQDSAIVFKVLSSVTPNGFQPNYVWFVNDVPYKSGVDELVFRPQSCSKNIFKVRVVMQDNASANFDDVHEWQVKTDGDSTLCATKAGKYMANNWYFGINAGVRFGGSQPIGLTDGAMTHTEGVASMSDTAGNLLFYTNGIQVFNRNHAVMPNGSGLPGNDTHTQILAIPFAGRPNQYILVTTMPYRYSVIDMTLDNGNGDIVPGQKDIILQGFPISPLNDISEKVTAAYAANQRDIWIITYANDAFYFNAFLVTESGISNVPVKSDFSDIALSPFGSMYGCMKVSPNGKHLVTADIGYYVNLYDFDTRTGIISNFKRITLPQGLGTMGSYGVEFSPNSKLVYVSYHQSPAIYQIDITLNTVQQMQDSLVTLEPNVGFPGFLQLGPDEKIYIARGVVTNYLSVINHPNKKGTACNLVVDGAFLNGRVSLLGLPGFISSVLVSNDIKYTNVCAQSPTQFELQRDLSSIDSVFWNFGDAQSANNTALGKNAAHSFTQAGTYSVTCIVRYDTSGVIFYDTISTDIEIKPTAYANTEILYFNPNPSCNDSIMLAPSTFGDSYQWYKDGQAIPGANSMSIIATQSGVYGVQIGSINGCAKPATDSVALVFLDGNVNPAITQHGLQLETQAFSSYQWYRNDTLLQGQTAQTVSLTSAGNYYVVVKNADGCEGESNKFLYQPVVIGIDETESAHFSFYPNPVRDVLFIQTEDKTTPVILTDINGHAVMRITEPSVNVSNLPAGLYFVTQGNSRSRFVKY